MPEIQDVVSWKWVHHADHDRQYSIDRMYREVGRKLLIALRRNECYVVRVKEHERQCLDSYGDGETRLYLIVDYVPLTEYVEGDKSNAPDC